MIQHVGEGGLEAPTEAFEDAKLLGNTEADRGCSRTLKDADSCISDPPRVGWRRCERIHVEEVSARLAGVEVVGDDVGTYDCSTTFRVGVGLIGGAAYAGREPWTGLKQCNRREIPTAQEAVQDTTLIHESPPVTEGKLVDAGE